MNLFSQVKSLPLALGRLRKLTDSEIHPLKQADLLFSEISKKRQWILETSQNFEKKTSSPNDCMFWIRSAANQVFQNEIMLRNNKRDLAMIKALGDFVPKKAESIDEFCDLIHAELNHLSSQYEECKEGLRTLKKESLQNQALQNKKRVASENIKSIQARPPREFAREAELVLAKDMVQNAVPLQDGLSILSTQIQDRIVLPEKPLLAPANPTEERGSLPMAHLEKAPLKTRPKVLSKIRLSPNPKQHKKEWHHDSPKLQKKKPDEQVLTEFAQFLSTVLKNP